ncbi:MAG: maleylpyruvate isomerase family mycothiol-dependent enzyme [Actinomycetes bacterium]
MSLATPLTHLAELASVEEELAADLESRAAAWSQVDSALPGWTRAHVVAHLTGNAYGLINLTRWAGTGTETPMYPSKEARASEIDRRAALPWTELLADHTRAVGALRLALLGLSEPVAARVLRLGSGARADAWALGAIRIREVEIHRVDLASDYTASDWSSTFTLRTLGELTPFFRSSREVPVHVLRATDTGNCWVVGADGADLVGHEADLLAWLLGRPYRDITTTDHSRVPDAPAWV